MLYKKYSLFDEAVEIMIPSDIKPADVSFASSQNSWLSKDRRTVINVTRGGADLTRESLSVRLNEYYKCFCRDINHFDCLHISKRMINRREYGEIEYLSHVTGYRFYNIFLLGNYGNREFIVTIQCLQSGREANVHIFENILDSIRVLRKQEEDMEDDRHAG